MKKIIFCLCLPFFVNGQSKELSTVTENSYYMYDYDTHKPYKITETASIKESGGTTTMTKVKVSEVLNIKIPERLDLELDEDGKSHVLKQLYAGDTLYENSISLLGDNYFSFWKTTKLGYVYNNKIDDIEPIIKKKDFKLTVFTNIWAYVWAFFLFFSIRLLIKFFREKIGLMVLMCLFFSLMSFVFSFDSLTKKENFTLVNLTNISSLLGLLTAFLIYRKFLKSGKKNKNKKPA